MATPKKEDGPPKRRRPPAKTPEGRENQLVSLAYDLAEQQLSDGTASSQVITHFLKQASTTQRLENEILKLQTDLVKAKTENLRAAVRTDELYQEALKAMRTYSGQGGDRDGV